MASKRKMGGGNSGGGEANADGGGGGGVRVKKKEWTFHIEAVGSCKKLASITVEAPWPCYILVEAAKVLGVREWHLRLFVEHDFKREVLDSYETWENPVEGLEDGATLCRVIRTMFHAKSTVKEPQLPPFAKARYLLYHKTEHIWEYKEPFVFREKEYKMVKWNRTYNIMFKQDVEWDVERGHWRGLSQDIVFRIEANHPFELNIGGIRTRMECKKDGQVYRMDFEDGFNFSWMIGYMKTLSFGPDVALEDVVCHTIKAWNSAEKGPGGPGGFIVVTYDDIVWVYNYNMGGHLIRPTV